ncbi:inversin isoform X2 [Entelurus aequoreus]|uniref:inversin isoform X2 n=1 Tax=Entelurus aequoreus TaxID=161455 RepID=UPI002B1D1943|nr:inversin isoform X2 [Entelurus aequoreus]
MASASSCPGGASSGSQVHAAAVNGDRNALLKLITAEPAVRDREDQFGRTPLMYCVLADRLDCAEILLKAGASVNKTDHSQRTALHLAAQKGNIRFLKLLLSRHANWLQKDLEEMTPLHLATRHPSPKALALLLKHIGPGEVDTQDKNKEAAPTESLLNWQDYEGRTPLHFAVADGNEAVVEVLTSYEGCNVTAYDNLFRTPMHWAALLGHARIVHLLLERNTSGTIPSDSQGATPLHYGAQSNNAETVGVFLSHPSVKDEPDLEGRTAFMWAAGKGSDDVIRTMLALTPHIDINMSDKYGGTALHAASLSGHMSTVQLLLERGAMVDSLDVMKQTPLFRACEMGHRDVILTLIKGSARVDLVDVDGHTALHWAALGGNAEVCQILMENGISPNVQDQAGRTPLQCAAYGGYITCMAVLMENHADPNIQDKEGRTALHWSCNNGYLDAVKMLLGYNTFPNHLEHTEERYTPLDYALLGGHSEVTQFMLEHGALSIAAIQDIAAASIQAVYKGYTVRKAFRERKQLLMRHEQLRKDAAKKREEELRRREAELQISQTTTDDQKLSLETTELKNLSFENLMADLSVNDSPVATSKPAKPERKKSKEERHKGHRSRSSRRKAADPADPQSHMTCDTTTPGVPVVSKLKDPTSQAASRPSLAKVRELRPSSSTPSMSAISRESVSTKKADPLKHRHHKHAREKNKDVTMEKAHNATHMPRGQDRERRRRRHEAARVIQRAWRRLLARRRTERVKARKEGLHVTRKKKTEMRASSAKPVPSKTSPLQNIYGNSMSMWGRSLGGSQLHLGLPLHAQGLLSGLDHVHLTEAVNQARQFSYHLRPHSAGQGGRGQRGKH